MKKIIALLLAFAILFPALYTKAYATSTSEGDLAFEMACELFPEYADTILNNANARSRLAHNSQEIVKVFEETREYSESLAITYTEFSDGTAFVSTNEFRRTFEQTDSEVKSAYLIHYTCNIVVYSTYDNSKKLGINGIEFYIDSLSYDNITNRGTIASGSVSHSGFNSTNKDWEDSSGHAYASYYADLPDSRGVILDTNIKFNVGDDSCYVTLNGEILTS